ncbi:hypothetical protein [Nesterenkonia halotolerans]|uniref:Glycerophosphoryl diester phosphodiesterase membrane domain-containing protein n=1 Tax=Nesterenkonia halotolerans TaxID=225325 RepID=A0ABR9J5H9_9MICC|nr:hypothetical protein [Nesterenkonia halotolerans]MBE1514251.1 hypothetical protein [Nesterenkonia halotolerans]
MIRTAATHRGARRQSSTTSSWSAPSGPEDPPEAEPLSPGRVFPLRRMVADELFSAAVAVIRRSPRAVLGVPFLAGLLNFGFTLALMVLLPSSSFMRMLTDPSAFEDPDLALGIAADTAFIWLTLASGMLTSLVLTAAAAYMVLPTLRAAYGLRTSMAQTMRLRWGRLGPVVVNLIVLGLLLSIFTLPVIVVAVLLLVITLFIGAVVVFPALFLALCWVTAAVMYSPAAVIVERLGPLAAIARSWRLNRGRWWRNIGLVALLYVILGIVFTIASAPLMITVAAADILQGSALPPASGEWASFLVFALTELYGTVVTTLFIGVVGTVVALMYLNARIRQEALDVTLLAAAEAPNRREQNAEDRLVPGSIEHLREHFQQTSAPHQSTPPGSSTHPATLPGSPQHPATQSPQGVDQHAAGTR